MRIKLLCITSVFLLIVCTASQVSAQQRFTAKALLGFNASQIRGDNLAGYDKLGLQAGLQMSYPLDDRWDVAIEMLFAQKGSQAELSFGTPVDIQRTTLNYLEVPIMIIIKDWYIEEEAYYKVRGHLGFSYGRLFDVSSSNGLYEGDLGNFKNNDVAIIAGIEYSFRPKLGLVVRYSNSITRIYENEILNVDGLINYLWHFGLSYKL